MDTEAGPLQAEVAEDTSSQYHVRNLMMRLCRQYLAGYFDLPRWDAQLLQKYSQGVKTFWLAQLNRSDPIFVTAEADRKLGRRSMGVRAIWTNNVKHARCIGAGAQCLDSLRATRVRIRSSPCHLSSAARLAAIVAQPTRTKQVRTRANSPNMKNHCRNCCENRRIATSIRRLGSRPGRSGRGARYGPSSVRVV